VLAEGILKEEGYKVMFDEIKQEMNKSAPTLAKTYNTLTANARIKEGIINFSL